MVELALVYFAALFLVFYVTILEDRSVSFATFVTRVIMRSLLWPFPLVAALVNEFPKEFARMRKDGW